MHLIMPDAATLSFCILAAPHNQLGLWHSSECLKTNMAEKPHTSAPTASAALESHNMHEHSSHVQRPGLSSSAPRRRLQAPAAFARGLAIERSAAHATCAHSGAAIQQVRGGGWWRALPEACTCEGVGCVCGGGGAGGSVLPCLCGAPCAQAPCDMQHVTWCCGCGKVHICMLHCSAATNDVPPVLN